MLRTEYAASVLENAKVFRNLLGSIEMRRRWKPKINLAILNGYVAESGETKCSKYPYTNSNPNFWKNKFQTLSATSGNKFEIKEINAAEISEEFAMVLNPFSEEYPEIDLKSGSVFFLIKDYVEDGGYLQ